MQIRRLGAADAPMYQVFRLGALRASPNTFSSSYEEERDTGLDVVVDRLSGAPDRAVFAAFADAQMIGMVGISREERRKAHHKGYLWGMYVVPQHRGAGAGKRLIAEALAFAASLGGIRQVNLAVSAGNAAALALYESVGFRPFGIEPGALLIEGVLHDDVHMARYLDTA